jgi:hypothetical protein
METVAYMANLLAQRMSNKAVLGYIYRVACLVAKQGGKGNILIDLSYHN